MQRDDVEQRPLIQLCRVVAHVALVPETTSDRSADDKISADLPEWLTTPQRDDLSLGVVLVAEDRHGQLIEADTAFGIAGPRNGAGAAWCRYHPACSQGSNRYRVCALDISESIDQMLGRDPALHSPPRLAWDSLLAALWAIDLHVTVEQLQAIPLTVILGEDVEAELDRVQHN
jgi:hypothetical protein